MAEDRQEPMVVANRLRQRLVGAAVIIALAVLLLPIWLDGSGLRTPDIQPVPKAPSVDHPKQVKVPTPSPDQMQRLEHPPTNILSGKPGQQPVQQPAPPAPATKTAPQPDTTPAPAAKSPQPPASSGSKPEAGSAASTQTAETKPPKPAPSPAKPAPEPKPAQSPAKSSPPPADQQSASADKGGWVVQLGSFSDELNAKGLQKSVSKAGFKVYIEPLFAKKGTVWRVRVGPFATRDEANKATERLRERLGRDGLVMAR